jgi:hypothetical protein
MDLGRPIPLCSWSRAMLERLRRKRPREGASLGDPPVRNL